MEKQRNCTFPRRCFQFFSKQQHKFLLGQRLLVKTRTEAESLILELRHHRPRTQVCHWDKGCSSVRSRFESFKLELALELGICV